MNLLNILRPAPELEEIEDENLVKKTYRYWRIRIFYGMYIGYAFFYFTRKSFTFAMPAMIEDLGLSKAELGILGSILSITYGLSKFLSGIIGDRSNPRYFMGIGLILTGVFNIFFGLSSTLILFALFWGLNGAFQGWGWPPCAKLLTHWYSQSERGRWWGFWNTSHNVGGAIIPLLSAVVASHYGWRAAMYVPGGLCILAGLFLINRLRDTPRSLGLPKIEKHRKDYIDKKHQDQKLDKKLSTKEVLWDYVIRNRFIWILAISYFFVYIIRTAVNDWAQIFFHEEKGFSILAATSTVFWFEIGGFFGSLSAGWTSDTLFKGRRGPINVIFTLGALFALIGIWTMPAGQIVYVSFLMFAVGFTIFGPQMLIGMAAAELSHKQAAGTSTGFVGWFAYLGAAVAGYPIGKITEVFGWYGFFLVITGCAIIASLLLLPLWAVKANEKLTSKR